MPRFLFSVYHPSGCRNRNHSPRDKLAACDKRTLDGIFNAAAAGNLHSHNGHALDIVVCNNGGQLVGVIDIVKLGTSDKRYAVADKLIVEIAVGVGGAVGGDEQICAVKIGRIDGHELDLNRPLRKLTL